MVVDGYVFARARAALRDSAVPLQSLLASQASSYAARWLCQYTPEPGTRLDAALVRVSVVEARQQGDTLSVTVRLPLQRPDCQVRAVSTPDAASATVGGDLVPATSFSVRAYPLE